MKLPLIPAATLLLFLWFAIAGSAHAPNACWADWGDCLVNVKLTPFGYTSWTTYCSSGIIGIFEGYGSAGSFHEMCELGGGLLLYYHVHWA